MTNRNRDYLVQEFKDGERPSGKDFEDLFDSFLNKTDDGLSLDNDGNVLLSRGVRLSDSNGTEMGTLRFHNNQVQYFNGAWVDLASGSGGAFQPIDSSTAVAYTTGNVGIGAFTTPPTYRLEVEIGQNSSEGERVRFGNVTCHNGTAAFSGYAYLSHRNRSNNNDYALRQGPNGNVHLNAREGQTLSIRQRGDLTRLGITTTGNVVVGAEANLAGASGYAFQVSGAAFKTDGGDNWNVLSDARVKEDVRDLDTGLEELMQVRPVRFRYNGKGGTRHGEEGVGIIGQEIEQVFPDMVERVAAGEEFDHEELLVYNGSALKYVLVNAVKQLAMRVHELEKRLEQSQNVHRNNVE